METYNIKKTDNEQTLTNVDWAACRELPHSDDIEKAILGALMVDSSALYHAIDKLETEYFYNKHNQLILNAIQSLYNDSKAVDILTVTEKLGRTGVLELSGGMLYVSQLASEVISAAHIDTHIAILKEKYVRREAIRISEETIREALINAMIHRSLQMNSDIFIHLYPDMVEISNPEIGRAHV